MNSIQDKKDKKVLFENFISVSLTQIILYVFPLITLPYLSRVLGAEKFGLVFWAQSMMMYGIMLTDFGFNNSAVREFSINRDNPEKMSEIFSSILLIKMFFVCICFLILTLAVIFVPQINAERKLFYLTFFIIVGNAFYPMYFFQGIEHMKYITFFNVVSRALFLGLIFIFVRSQSDYLYVALINSFAFLIPGIFALWLAHKRFGINFKIPSKQELIHQIKYSSEFFLARVSVSGYTNTNMFVLGLIVNPVLTGYYASAEKIYTALGGLASPFSQILYPYVAKSRNIERYKKIFGLAILFFVCTISVVFIFSKDIVMIFYGAELIPAYKILKIFCFASIIAVTSNLLGFPLLGGMGYTKDANYSIIFASILHIIGLIALLVFKSVNIYTVALLVIFTEAFVLGFRIFKIVKYKIWSYNMMGNKYE